MVCTREVWGGSEQGTAQRKGFGATAINLQLSKHIAKWSFEAIIRIMGEGHFHLLYLDGKCGVGTNS